MARILLVDDDIDTLALLTTLLKFDNHETACAHEAETALQAYQIARNDGRNFDLILTDLALPYTNGIEMVQKIRNAGDWSTCIAFLSAASMSSLLEGGTIDRIEALQPCGIWTKPIDAPTLLGNVRECLKAQ